MADRYWVGGTGTWDATTTTNWSATSGGAGGASAPTSADNVFFNSLSNATAYTVTVTGAANCADMTMAGPLAGNVTWAGTGNLNVSGSMTVASTGITRTYTGNIAFLAITTGKTITVGVTLASSITFNGIGGGWTLGSALSTGVSNSITFTAGAFNTSAVSSYALTCGTISASSATTSSASFNASTITILGTDITVTGAGFTLNAGTSQINLTSAITSSVTSSGRTFYNLAFTGAPSTQVTHSISGVNTFNNLAFTAPSNARAIGISFSSSQTINGTLSGSGASEIRRIFYFSNAIGSTRTLTLANPATLTNCDFRDITAATSAITATGGGDCGGNTNITGFPAPKTVYWNLAGSQAWSATAWATSSGGSPAAANFPLAQDTAVFDNAGATGMVTHTSSWNVGTVNMSARTSAMTLSTAGATLHGVYGNWLNGSGVTMAGTSTLTFAGRGNTQQILGNGVPFTQPLTFQNVGGTVQLTSAVTVSSSQTTLLTAGTLDLQSYTLTTGQFSSSNNNTRTIAFGTGNITVNGTGLLWTTSTVTNLTVTGTPVVNLSNNTATSSTLTSGTTTESNSISFNITTGTYSLTLNTGSKRDLNFTGFAGTVSNTAQTIYGSLTLSSAATYTAGTNAWTFSSTTTDKTITSSGVTVDWPLSLSYFPGLSLTLQDALTMGSTRTFTHSSGTLNLNGKTLTVGTSYTTATGTKNITFNSGTLVCPAATAAAFNNAVPTGFTTTAGTGTGAISMTGATAKSFQGGGSTYNCTLNQGGAGALTITGANTFNDITNTVQPASVLFTAGTTTTFNNFNLNGTAGNLITIASATAATHTLSKASGTVSRDYLSITNSTATGGAYWYAGANSTNGGGNTGWIFTTGAFFSIL